MLTNGRWLDFRAFEVFFWCALILGQQSKGAGGWIGEEGGVGSGLN